MLCVDCGLAQLRDLVDVGDLFSHYVYFSSNSETMLQSAEDLVKRVFSTLSKESFVIEIASNDGYLLKNYIDLKINVLGIDPAKNIAKIANEQGVPTLCDFFGETLAEKLSSENKKADIIHANNVMAHVPDIVGFIRGMKCLLKPKGYAIIEVPYFLDLVQHLEFDTIYHEHVFYFTVQSLKIAFEKQGLEIFDIEKLSIHGGTLRLFVGHQGARDIGTIIDKMIKNEKKSGLYTLSTYSNFMKKIFQLGEQLRETLDSLKESGSKIAAYGASAKGTTLLNFFDIDQGSLEFIVDRSPVKQSLYTPGTYLEVRPPSSLLDESITHALLLVWNFSEEILNQQKKFINKGGKFIVPLPEVKVVP
jgi:SAM-dependent methyltransferase